MNRSLRVRAFAKINLTLRVLGVRADGYHELRTTFQSIALHDTLTFSRAKAFSLHCDDPSCPSDRTNLVWRAAVEMWRAAGRRDEPSGVAVKLVKRVPMQAGLGGGSSDAAAALRAFARLWNVKDGAVADVAAGLGADVPFFLHGGTALGVERGDLLFPLVDWPASSVVLVLPDFGVSTRDAYAWFDEKKPGVGSHSGSGAVKPGSGAFLRGTKKGSRPRLIAPDPEWLPTPEIGNDLEGPVAEHHPEISRMVGALQRAGASYAAMSGSGSAVFGLFSTSKAAEKAARRLAGPRQRTILTCTLGRASFLSRSRPA